MIRLIAGSKGEGKTKRMIEMANESVKNSDGHVVYIDFSPKHIYDLHHKIRLVEAGDFPLSNYREFIGFICGILSQDHDITDIFVDSYAKIVKRIDGEELSKLFAKLDNLNHKYNINFTICVTCEANELADDLKKYMMQ